MKQKEDELTIDMFEDVDYEEAHYVQTLNDVVELMVNYGQLKVLMDITTKMQEVTK